jgi:glycosyltransferase involved in cell wall biosynthesis
MTDTPLRIALVTRTLVDDGGVTIHVRRSAAALERAGHDVLMVAGALAGLSRGVEHEELLAGQLSKPGRARLARAIRAADADVVHFHNVDDPVLVQTLASVTATVVSAHGWSGCGPNTRFYGAVHECPRAHGPGCVRTMLLRNCKHTRDPRSTWPFYRAAASRLSALRGADAAVAYSTEVAAHLRHNAVERVWPVPLPVAVPAAPPEPPAGPPLVAFAGRIVPVKGLDVLLRSMRWFAGDLEVVGDGWARPSIARLVDELGLHARVRLRGWVGDDAVADLLRRAHVVAFPSVWPEPFGMVGPQAMAHGRPVVASGTGGVRDWLEHERTGLAVEPRDPEALGRAIARILSDPALGWRMGQAGRERVIGRFDGGAHVAALLDVYRAAIARRRLPVSAR